MATRVVAGLVKRQGPAFKRFQVMMSGSEGSFLLKVGFIGTGSTEDGDLTNAGLAAIMEFGAPEVHIPERPFMSLSFATNLEKYKAAGRQLAAAVANGQVSVEKGLNILGSIVATDIRDFIVDGSEVPPTNADSVKERKLKKGANTQWGLRTLVDTGHLVRSITWVVVRVGGPT